MSLNRTRQEEEEEEVLFPPIVLDTSYTNVVIVESIPIIPREKLEKLTSILKKILSHSDSLASLTIVDFDMPFEEGADAKSKGFALVRYSNEEEARLALRHDKTKLDKNHILRVSLFGNDAEQDDGDDGTAEFKPPENLQAWLLQKQYLEGKDQYLVRWGDESQILWNSVHPELEVGKSKWTISGGRHDWSPLGTYLVSYHQLGLMLWGGTDWNKQLILKHAGVTMAQFSPNERYIITFSETLAKNDDPNDPRAFLVWDLTHPARPARGFPFKDDGTISPFKWSFDEKYFSRIKDGLIYIYETATMQLTLKDAKDQRIPLKLHAKAMSHAWSPTANFLAVFVPERNDIPARISLMDFPNVKPIAVKALMNVLHCHIHWQPQGQYLAVKIDRQKNAKSPTFTSFEFFRVYEKNIPIEGVELSKDNVIAFAFEPKGTRFAIIHADATSAAAKPNVSIYNIEPTKIVLLKTFEQRLANHLYWSPNGRFLLLAGLKTMNGQLEFIDVVTMESIAKEVHQVCTDITWDYSGRFVATYVSNWKNKTENGFMVWTCRGKKVYQLNKDPFFQFLWRPKPPTVLPKEQLDLLQQPAHFKKHYQKKYKQLEKVEQDLVTSTRRAEQEKLKSDYQELLLRRLKEQEADVNWRKSVGIHDDAEADYYFVEECVEEILEEKVEVIET